MPNQKNFPERLNSTLLQRPSRVYKKDLALIRNVPKQVLFGTNDRDVVEIWIYNPDGSFGGHLNLGPTDQALAIVTLIDNTGPYEVLNIDLKAISNRMALDPGRYAMVANFLRDEVGSEKGNKLYISTISEDRTELRLEAVTVNAQVLKEMYEWVVPSVPRLFAQGLIDQTFGKNINVIAGEQITTAMMDSEIDRNTGDSIERMKYAGVYDRYQKLCLAIFERTYAKALDGMATDVKNLNVQQIELEAYIYDALYSVLHNAVSSGEFDTQLALV